LTKVGMPVPALIRWPGRIKPGTNFTELFSAEDWLVTLVAAAGGDPNLRESARKGVTAGNKAFKVHLDGYNQLDCLTGKSRTGARHEFYYFSDDGDLMAFRDDRFKYHYAIQEAVGPTVWMLPMTRLRMPQIVDLSQELQGLPAAVAASQLLHRPDHRAAGGLDGDEVGTAAGRTAFIDGPSPIHEA
jgi:arylsulfatase A-like enzyme